MKKFLNEVLSECLKYTKQGVVASYIPELAKADPADFGICIMTHGGKVTCVGDYEKQFTMQSVIKPIILLLALMDKGENRVRSLVGVEATGKPFDAFNYSDRALTGDHINPMINAGAIALCSLIEGKTNEEKFARLLNLARKLADDPGLEIDQAVYASEKATGNKNRALGYMLKAYGMIDCNVEEVVDLYFRACSVKISCTGLARIALVLSSKGKDPKTGEQLFCEDHARFVNAILAICGMYDGSGEFALNVGIPAKSGVGGGIMAVVPSKMGIGIYSPGLDKKGNSYAGVKALEIMSKKLDLSVF